MAALKNKKHEAYCLEYMRDRDGAKAAVRAGYSPRTAPQQAYNIMQRDDVKARMAELEEELRSNCMLDAAGVVQRWTEIATADPRELMQFRRFACRFCWGKNHEYQYRAAPEFREVKQLWKDTPKTKRGPEPKPLGGYGYSTRLEPNPKCPMCDGYGRTEVTLADTSTISPGAAALFAGVKQTQHGIEIKTHSQPDALKNLATHLGLFKGKGEGEEAIDGLTRALKEIAGTGSAAPIVEDPDDDEDEEVIMP